jgi:catechol 2,3-dioxygenase-like lactoylglutathione lyase family enzyme
MLATAWPEELPAKRVRIARPADRVDEVVHFYVHGLGLRELSRFDGHSGYRGVMLGLPGAEYHLEFTPHVDGSPCPAPTRDNLLVRYFDGPAQVELIAARLAARGYSSVEAENPYWTENGAVTVQDPDGWRVVLMPRPSFMAAS